MASSEASETRSIITGLLTSTPLRCTVRQLCNDFYNTVGYNIPFRKLGFANVEDYLRSIPGTVHIIGSGPSAEVQGVVSEKSAHINTMVAKQKKDSIPAHKRKNIKKFQSIQPRPSSSQSRETERDCAMSVCSEDKLRSRIPKRIQNNLRKLLMKFPDGIWCTKLKEEYWKMFREDLCYEKYHFRSLIELCTDLSDIFHYIQPTTDDYILYDRNKAVPSLNQNEIFTNEQDCFQFSQINWSLGPALIPADVVQFLEEIPQISLEDLELGDHLEISIGEIYDIRNFFIFPRDGDLSTIKTELDEFFHHDRNRYEIHRLFMEVGLYCTVYYKSEYHRAVIIDLQAKEPEHVKVLFIDYGSVGVVGMKNIWYLPKRFGAFPRQVVKARLSNMKPTNDHHMTTEKFKQLIRGADLIAEVVQVDKEKSLVEIYLANVTDPENIFYVNDALVDKGYAEFC